METENLHTSLYPQNSIPSLSNIARYKCKCFIIFRNGRTWRKHFQTIGQDINDMSGRLIEADFLIGVQEDLPEKGCPLIEILLDAGLNP